MYEYRTLPPDARARLVQDRLTRGYPPHSPPHPIADQPFYLLAAACYEHLPIMNTEARRRLLLDRLFALLILRDMEMLAWIVLPNHYHLLVRVDRFSQLREVFRLAHGRTASLWNHEDVSPGRTVWYSFADPAIRSEAHYNATLNYMHYNPVKHGLAATPYHWAASSVHGYLAERGREWLKDLWGAYPLRSYGEGWDEG